MPVSNSKSANRARKRKVSAKRVTRNSAILAVRMEHDTRWTRDGHEYAMVWILVPRGSKFAPKWINTKRWVPLDGAKDLHAEALEQIQKREMNWYVDSWVLARAPDGEEYIECTEFATQEPARLDDLEDVAQRAKTENMNAINPRHFVARGWTAKTFANMPPFYV